MTFEQILPEHWNFIFEMVVLIGLFATAIQVKLADVLDQKRFNSESMSLLFQLRRGSRWIKGLMLCWLAVYAYNQGWKVWPPVMAFVAAFDVWVLLDVFVMRKDMKRLQQRDALGGRPSVQHLR